MDAVVMFKTLFLGALYNLSDDQIEYQVRDRVSSNETKVAPRSVWISADVMIAVQGFFMAVCLLYRWVPEQPHSARAPVAIHRPWNLEPGLRCGQKRHRDALEQRPGERSDQPPETPQTRYFRPGRSRIVARENATIPPHKLRQSPIKIYATSGDFTYKSCDEYSRGKAELHDLGRHQPDA